jgi:hypothetical protein
MQNTDKTETYDMSGKGRPIFQEVGDDGERTFTATPQSKVAVQFTDKELLEAFEKGQKGCEDDSKRIVAGLRGIAQAAVEKTRRINRSSIHKMKKELAG